MSSEPLFPPPSNHICPRRPRRLCLARRPRPRLLLEHRQACGHGRRRAACTWCAPPSPPRVVTLTVPPESGEALIIPVFWPGVEGALALLADREARIAAAATASLKRKAQESGAKGAEPPQKMQRVTRASMRQQQTPGDTTTPPSEKKRRAPPPPSETPTPQRASARQQEKKMPAAVRARSTSQDSSETIVASSSSSRAVSVADSADTVVGGDHNKGTPADESVAPIAAEATRMVTRSRTAAPVRPTPYPATKTAGKRAPTGKRKTAKSRV
ncbi:hypothetical protein B0H11DRAFT_2085475 [Mycena galericulata]|nr:hypothetical protein B0H11DRAFT_2085475 [Mycena galericulata]